MAMQSQKLLFSGPLMLILLVQFLTVQHAACAAACSKASCRPDTTLSTEIRVGNDLKSGGHKSVSSQQRGGFIELAMAARTPPAGVIIVHARQVVMDERITVQHFQCAGVVQGEHRILAGNSTGRQRKDRAHTFAAPQQAVAGSLTNTGLLR